MIKKGNSMKKITFLLLHLNYGGLEKQVTTLANELAKSYDVELVVLYDLLNGKSFYKLNDNIKVKFVLKYGPIKAKQLKEMLKKIKIIELFKSLAKDIKLIFTKYFGVGKIVNNIKTDVLISSRIEFSRQIKRRDILTISQEHSYVDTPSYVKKVKKSFKNIKYLVVMTDKAKENYQKWLNGNNTYTKVIKIPNAINSTNKKATLDSNQIISVGRLEDVKDFETLILVFSMCLAQNNNLRLEIVGDGSKKEELVNLCKSLNILDYVRFTGKLDSNQVEGEMLKSSLFLLTSKSESFSLVLVEASSLGIPCISFDIDVGPREIIKDGKNGFIIKDRNKELMKKKILEIMNSRDVRNEIGNNAKINAEKYYIENVVNEWKKILK